MAIVLSLVIVAVLVGVSVVIGVLVNQNIKATKDLHQLVVKQERDRMHAKCSGLFARVFRGLARADGFMAYTYKRVEFNIMELNFGSTSINVAVREYLGSFETGQLIAYANGYPTIHSCEEDTKVFAIQIRQAVTALDVRRSA